MELFCGKDENWSYTRIPLPLKSPNGEKEVTYPVKVRYNEDGEYQIFSGIPKKNIGWHSVESESIKSEIEKQI